MDLSHGTSFFGLSPPAQLMLRSDIHYYARGSIIAENHETAYALMVITSGLVGPSSASETLKGRHCSSTLRGLQNHSRIGSSVDR
jgi:signal-transduction protein with cAMP-binding, CBS, and nucleotidyltransferase domain